MEASRKTQDRTPAPIQGLEREAYLHILSREHTAQSLAKAVGTSVPTAARALARLRKALAARGMMLVSVRAGDRYHYEIRDHDRHVREAWKRSGLRALAGAGKKYRPFPGKGEDEIIYDEE